MSKEDLVEVTVKLPRGVVDFLTDMGENLEEYIVYTIVHDIAAGLDADAWCLPKYWVKKHNLGPIFQQHKISVSSYINPAKPGC